MSHRLKPLGEEGGRSVVVSQKRDHNVDRVWPWDIKRGEAEATNQQFASTITPSGVRDERATLLEGEALAPGANAAPQFGECEKAGLSLFDGENQLLNLKIKHRWKHA